MMEKIACVVNLMKPSNECFIGSPGVNKIIENPQSVVEEVSAIKSDHLIQLCTEQSNLYRIQNVQQKAAAKSFKLPNITPKEIKTF